MTRIAHRRSLAAISGQEEDKFSSLLMETAQQFYGSRSYSIMKKEVWSGQPDHNAFPVTGKTTVRANSRTIIPFEGP
jgi:hypothetical protein